MQVVKVTISNPAPEVEESATIILETRRGDNWNREDAKDLAIGKSEQSSTFQLGRNQRLVIEARTEAELKYDPVQSAAVDMKQQIGKDGADAPKEKAEGTHLKQAEDRALRDAKLNTAPGMIPPTQSPLSPPSADVNKKDETAGKVGATSTQSLSKSSGNMQPPAGSSSR